MNKTYQIIVSGKVQGVFYRESTQNKAKELGLCGTVKNLKTGEVEIFIAGDENIIHKLVDWCKIGPKNSKVNEIIIKEIDNQKFIDFKILF
ncbi:acylphosphatase [Candidatus Woesearchaeota archaeon]|jgi:acylphosphatase|nr:acylphosphatase [Candidatus Woesearchaeota archaeon]